MRLPGSAIDGLSADVSAALRLLSVVYSFCRFLNISCRLEETNGGKCQNRRNQTLNLRSARGLLSKPAQSLTWCYSEEGYSLLITSCFMDVSICSLSLSLVSFFNRCNNFSASDKKKNLVFLTCFYAQIVKIGGWKLVIIIFIQIQYFTFYFMKKFFYINY